MALSPFLSLPGLEGLVITAPPGREVELLSALSESSRHALEKLGPGRFSVIPGGSTRRDSVRAGLETVAAILPAPLDDLVVLIHDGARPWVTPELVSRIAVGAIEKGACVPIVPLVDTPKELGTEGLITRHPPRASLGGVQTPQGFWLCPLLEAHRRAAVEKVECTDDAELWDRYVGPVSWIPGDQLNRKITVRADLGNAESVGTELVGTGAVGTEPELVGTEPELESAEFESVGTEPTESESVGTEPAGTGSALSFNFRIGQGWDLHRLIPLRRLMLGGVEIPNDLGEDAHSDGDVLLHAIIDAMLGAAALGDIGTYFPPSDENWRDADSRDLARRTAAIVRSSGWEIGNIDCSVILERPRLGPYRTTICDSIASCLGITVDAISLKAKTAEGLGAVGEGRAVEAIASVLLYRP